MADNIYSRQQRKLKQRGFSEADAQRISYFAQKRKGNLDNGKYALSDNGKAYSQLSSLERQILRRSQREGKPAYAYKIVNGKIRLRDEYRKNV